MNSRILISMMLLLVGLSWNFALYPQVAVVKGTVLELRSAKPIEGVVLKLEGNVLNTSTDANGRFIIYPELTGRAILSFQREPYRQLVMELALDDLEIDLGVVYMEIDLQVQQPDDINVFESILEADDDIIPNTGILRAGRDLLASRAAFDFGQVFFRIRGYDSRSGIVTINGIQMNRLRNGRPQWNNWGGLNDVFRNQDYVLGLGASAKHFGDVRGIININTRPGTLRPGLRFTSSFSNRTYLARLMATFNRAPEASGWGYTLSASARWAEQGFVSGTSYDAYSVYAALEHQFKPGNGLYLTAFLASNQKGRNSAITQEVHQMTGRKYNPNWGMQNDEIRNSKIRNIREPVLMLNYYYNSRKLDIETGLAYQWGVQSNTRLGYYNAPNPSPEYYQYLPSYFINSPIGANFIGAEMAKNAFIENPQINWSTLYHANRSLDSKGKASYVFYGDTRDERIIRAHINGKLRTGAYSYLDMGFNYSDTLADNYARIDDLLGADYHEDIDPFSETLNEVNGILNKKENDIFGYHYIIRSRYWDAFAQWRFVRGKWNGFVAGKYYNSSYEREGLFENERYPENSFGRSKTVDFANYGLKGGISFELTKRHRFEVNATYSYRPPVLENIFINPRENNEFIIDIPDEKISSLDLGYRFQMPKMSGRVSGFYTKFQHTTDINFFFVNSGVGSDFVQEQITDLDRLHAGIELGLSIAPSSTVTLTAAASISKYLYSNNPNVRINFDTAGPEEDLINIEGQEDLGLAELKDKKLARGPAQAISLGIEYRDPHYWRLGFTINRLAENYIRISPLTRTESFKINPDTGLPFPDATPENLSNLLKQRPLEPVYLLNMNFGKSWLKGKKYIYVFAGISNLLDSVFVSGGYEQSRNGNFGQAYRDNLSGRPSFGPKFWYGYGRTFYLNLSVSFQ